MTQLFVLDQLNGVNGFSVPGLAPEDLLGISVSGAGDFNDDGIDDFLIGALGVDPADGDETDISNDLWGASYLIFGTSNVGANGTIDLANLDASQGIRFDGLAPRSLLGDQVAKVGDLNNDGFDDISFSSLILDGTIGIQNYVVFGGNAIAPTGQFDLATLDGTNGVILTTSVDDFFGRVPEAPMDTIGDVNGDGVDDMILGLSVHFDCCAQRSYVIFGQSDFSTSATINLDNLDGTDGFIVDTASDAGASLFNELGSVSGLGDINDDGIDDFIIGRADEFEGSQASVIFGSPTIGQGGFFDIDSLDGSNGTLVTWSTNILDSISLGISVDGIGDFNGDGIEDMAIAADIYGATDHIASAYVVFGGNTLGTDGLLTLVNLSEEQGVSIIGLEEDQDTRFYVSGAGDVNGDGFDDLILSNPSAYSADGTIFSAGVAYVVFGRSITDSNSIDLANLEPDEGFAIADVPGSQNAIGISISGVGDVNNDGVDDIAIGAIGISTVTTLGTNGKTDVIFGNIAPELSLDGADSVTYDGSPVALFESGQISLTDANSTTLSAASIQLVDTPDTTNEQLSVNVAGTSLATTYNAATGVLSVSGTAAIATYQQVLETLTYQNLAAEPDTTTRTVELTVDDGAAHSNQSNVLTAQIQFDLSAPTIITGTNGADNLVGSAEADQINGLNGADILIGRAGNDTIDGGAGADTLLGRRGNDQLFGGKGRDQLVGDRGQDLLDGGEGSDRLSGGGGADLFVIRAGDGRDQVLDFQDGVDQFQLADGLTFDDLTIGSTAKGARIRLADTGDVLMIVLGVAAEQITAADIQA